MEFISLKSIIYDLLNIIRNANIVDDESISERQIEAWIHEYRADLIKKELDKKKYPNPAYIQNINNVTLEYDISKGHYKTSIDIPNFIDLNYGYSVTFIGDNFGNQIQIVPESRVVWQKHKRFTQEDTLAFINNKRIYIVNSKGLNKINIRGIFENPLEAIEANNGTITYDIEYPIPSSLVVNLKKLLLKEKFGIELTLPSDINNDATGLLLNNVEGKQ